MSNPIGVLAAFIVVASTHVAHADDSCDYFMNLLMATKCKNNIQVGIGLDYEQVTTKATDQFGDATSTKRTWTTPSGSLAYSPNDWLKFTATTQARFFTDAYSENFYTVNGQSATSTSFDWLGFSSFAADATLYDSGQAGSTRYLITAALTAGYRPEQTGSYRWFGNTPTYHIAEESFGEGTLAARGLWRFGNTDWAAQGRAALSLERVWLSSSVPGTTNSATTYAVPSADFMLVNDRFGLEIGPTFSTNYLIDQHKSPTYVLGGLVYWQPFRALDNQWLNGLVLTGSAAKPVNNQTQTSPGFYSRTTSTDQVTIGSSATFNFRF